MIYAVTSVCLLFWACLFLRFHIGFYRCLLKHSQDTVLAQRQLLEQSQWQAKHLDEIVASVPWQQIGYEIELHPLQPIGPNILPYIQQLKCQNELLKRENQHLHVHLARFPHGMDCGKFSHTH